ncbi:AAA family ATPase [Nitrospirillum amazonense]|uniref:AAA family ATPase n=1 Tax=Nitrospirillum amazonense TaxID=28077 RepID=UPI002412DB54|nr:AAA family ATPase [Nitrospirillum amazonense]MDG3439756.1 AAA family ATPase [Nitrospirillum amazonense]
MELKSFRVRNFRSINDSGEIDVSRITALLGRNESGKSNVLRALHSLNPAGGFEALNPIKDFPRHCKLSDCNDNTPVVDSIWILSKHEQQKLAEIWPAAEGVSEVTVGRCYGKTRYVGMDASQEVFDIAAIKSEARKIDAAVKARASKLVETAKAELEQASNTFVAAISTGVTAATWAASATPALAALRQALAAADVELTDTQDQKIIVLEEMAEAIPGREKAHESARKWIIQRLPIFIYLEDYPEIKGHQDITQFLQRKRDSSSTLADINFEKLCKVAGLSPDQLQILLQRNDQETRSQLANRAGAVVTTAIRKRWKDRELKVRFNLDGSHFDTLISDPNSVYDVEVNLDERSRGFQWFFAFYIVFAADTEDGNADGAVLLLDEPGLYLHARSQGDLLRHLESDFKNQIIYTTHSPFMVPTHHLDWVRTVNITEDEGTTVSNDPNGDARTLFPLQAALGYDLAQSLFVGPNNLVVEGVTDFWILSAVSAYLKDQAKIGLDERLVVTPSGGAQKVHYMVALLTSEKLNVLVLFDDEKDAKATRDDLIKGKLIRSDNVIFASQAFKTPPAEADIEDILDPKIYEALVREAYAKELRGKKLELNAHIPRIARRVEAAFDALSIGFHKTRPARLFLQKMVNDPASVLPATSQDQFECLFKAINAALEKHLLR